MTDLTPNLGLPVIAAAQAQKHVTHNEALALLDSIVQASVLDKDLTAPPGGESEGDTYIVGAGAAAAWSGHDGALARWQGGGWTFIAPREGWRVWVADEGAAYVFTGSAWTPGFARVEFATFAPVIAPQTPGTWDVSYAQQIGFGVKLGPLPGTTYSLVWLQIGLQFTPTIGTGSGTLLIAGHPWSIANVSGLQAFSGTVHRMNASWIWPASTTQAILRAQSTAAIANNIVIVGQGSGLNTPFEETTLSDTNTHNLEGSVFYLTGE